MRIRTGHIIAAAAVTAISATGIGVAAATQPGSDDSRVASRPDATTAAKRTKRGPRGVPGRVGPAGPRGPVGPAGPSGTVGVTVRKSEINVPGNPGGGGSSLATVARCRPGEIATGGGVRIFGAAAYETFVFGSSPEPAEGTPTGWYGAVRNTRTDGAVARLQTYVLCAAR